MSSSKSRATLHSTLSRARQIEAEYLQSMNPEDLAFSTSNKKKDAERKTELRRQQRLKELAAVAEKNKMKEQLRKERDLKRFLENEWNQMKQEQKIMLREEIQQKAIEEIVYCQSIQVRFPKKGIDDIRNLLLKFQNTQPSRTIAIHNQLIQCLRHERTESIHALIRWRRRSIETIYELIIHTTKRENVRQVHNEILNILQIDERRRRELLLWPKNILNTIGTVEVDIPILATCSFFDQELRNGNLRLLHVLCHRGDKKHGILGLVILLSCGSKIEIDVVTETGMTSLHFAASQGFNDIIQLLLNYKADPRAKNNILATPLLLAVDHGHLSTVRLLFNLGGGIPMLLDANDRGLTPLHIASSMGYTLMTEQIVQWITLGKNVLVIDRKKEMVEKKSYGKSVENQRRNTGCYRAPIASEGERSSISSRFYTRKAKDTRLGIGSGGWKLKPINSNRHGQIISAVTKRGVTPLMCAAFHNNKEIVGMLSVCMNTNEIAMRDNDGHSAKDYAKRDVTTLDGEDVVSIHLIDPLL